MAKISVLDRFPNVVRYFFAVPTVAGTINPPFKISSNYNPKDLLVMKIQRVRYILDKTRMNLDAVLDEIRIGLCLQATVPSAGFVSYSSGLLDYNSITQQFGTSVGAFPVHTDIVKDFSSLQGGGLICHPASLYAWNHNACTADLAATVSVIIEIYYTLEDLTPADWQEMWQLGYITSTI